MIHLTEEDVRLLLPMKDAVAAVRESFLALAGGGAENQPRRRLFIPAGSVLHQMSARFGGYFGTKVYATNVKRGALAFHVLLYEAATAEPLALLEANALGQIRTGAATGVATQLLAVDGPVRVGMIGSGFQAWTQLEAVAAVREIAEARVWSRSEEKRSRFAKEAGRAFGISVKASASAEEAIGGAEVVVTATYAKDPVIEDGWVHPQALVNAAGSNQANRREVPADLVRRAALIAVDSLEQARIEAGDLLLAAPPESWGSMGVVEIGELMTGEFQRPQGVVMFESLGLAVQDIAVAGIVYERARAAGAGREI